MVTFLGTIVQLFCGEGGTLQTNIVVRIGECSQCFSHTGFAPTHGVSAFMVYTSQALSSSAGNCLRRALVCMHIPGLSRSGSGSWVLQKGRLSWACVLYPSQVQAAQVTRCLASALTPRWGLCLITSPVPAAQFSGCTMGAPSRVCCMSLLGGLSLAATLPADVNHPESQVFLVSTEACLQFGKGCLSGAAIAPFRLWLPLPACLWQGMGQSAVG